jgi:hypothetical protein
MVKRDPPQGGKKVKKKKRKVCGGDFRPQNFSRENKGQKS